MLVQVDSGILILKTDCRGPQLQSQTHSFRMVPVHLLVDARLVRSSPYQVLNPNMLDNWLLPDLILGRLVPQPLPRQILDLLLGFLGRFLDRSYQTLVVIDLINAHVLVPKRQRLGRAVSFLVQASLNSFADPILDRNLWWPWRFITRQVLSQ